MMNFIYFSIIMLMVHMTNAERIPLALNPGDGPVTYERSQLLVKLSEDLDQIIKKLEDYRGTHPEDYGPALVSHYGYHALKIEIIGLSSKDSFLQIVSYLFVRLENTNVKTLKLEFYESIVIDKGITKDGTRYRFKVPTTLLFEMEMNPINNFD